MGLEVENERDMTSKSIHKTILFSLMFKEALKTYIGDYSVQRVYQDKVKGGGGGGGQTDLQNKKETLMRIS